jgi:hypothetical protein
MYASARIGVEELIPACGDEAGVGGQHLADVGRAVEVIELRQRLW